MNEQRTQAHIELVQKLLNCSDGEENQVIQQSPELLDRGLVQVMKQAVIVLQQRGQEEQANKLQGIATQLLNTIQKAEDLQDIVQELSQPPQNIEDMGRRIKLCLIGLMMVSRKGN
ncbi:MAG: hypothetical protein AAF329_17385, partial [Cyanobacteria bacterium P01_A01_bin.17]